MLLKKPFYFMVFFIVIFIALYFICNKINKDDEYLAQNIYDPETRYLSATELPKKLSDFYQVEAFKEKNSHTSSLKEKNDKSRLNETYQALEEIKKLLQDEVSIIQIDKKIISLLEDNTITRNKKIDGLWDLVLSFGISSEKGIYLLDYLSTLLPIELTDELISNYYSISDINTKMKLMDVLYTSLDIANPEVQNEEQLNYIASQYLIIQDFIYEQLSNTSNNDVFTTALSLYTKVASPEQTQEVITSVLNGSYGDKNINKEQALNLMTESALSTYESQNYTLPSIISSLETEIVNDDVKKSFSQNIINAINAGIISDENKEQLSYYLKNQEPELYISKDIPIENMEEYYNWAKAITNLNSNTHTEIIQKLADKAISEDNLLKSSAIILYSDEDLIYLIRESRGYQNISNRLNIALSSNDISNDSKIIIQDAIKVISINQ